MSALPEPLPVQTNRPFPGFAVRLLDFYQNTVVIENGTAVVSLGKCACHMRPLKDVGWQCQDRGGRPTLALQP